MQKVSSLKKWPTLLFVATLGLFLSQCAGTGGGSTGFSAIVVEDTAFREFGPNQSVPSSEILTKGTRVKILRNAGASSYVQTVGGKEGYVNNAYLKIRTE